MSCSGTPSGSCCSRQASLLDDLRGVAVADWPRYRGQNHCGTGGGSTPSPLLLTVALPPPQWPPFQPEHIRQLDKIHLPHPSTPPTSSKLLPHSFSYFMLLLFAKIFCLDIEVHNLNEFKFRTNLVDRNGILTRLEKAAGR